MKEYLSSFQDMLNSSGAHLYSDQTPTPGHEVADEDTKIGWWIDIFSSEQFLYLYIMHISVKI